MKNILFVCTGNAFRSLTAHKILEKHVERNKLQYSVSSAGTKAKPQQIHKILKIALREQEVCLRKWEQHKISLDDIIQADYIVCMSQKHVTYIKKHFDVNTNIYNEVLEEEGGVPDVEDVLKGKERTDENIAKHIQKTVRYISKTIPTILNNIETFNLKKPSAYNDFKTLLEEKHHRNSYQYIPIKENNKATSFIALTSPPKQKGQILVIPKKQYATFHNIPRTTRIAMMDLVQTITKEILHFSDGYNILMNNGKAAGQTTYHAHIHIIPRTLDDEIGVQRWTSKNITEQELIKYTSYWKEKL